MHISNRVPPANKVTTEHIEYLDEMTALATVNSA